MSQYELYNLVISGFGALGTCGATILALYFWFHSEKPHLIFNVMHVDTYGQVPLQTSKDGFIILRIGNSDRKPIKLNILGFKIKKDANIKSILKFKKSHGYRTFWPNNLLLNNCLPCMLDLGEEYVLVASWGEFIENLKEYFEEDSFSRKQLFVVACVSSYSNDIEFKLPREIHEEIASKMNAR